MLPWWHSLLESARSPAKDATMRSPAVTRSFALSVTAALLPMLAACAADTTQYPSLARRPAEKIADSTPAPDPSDRVTGGAGVVTPSGLPDPAIETPSPELAARIDQLVRQARTAHNRFAEHRARTAALVSAGQNAAVASEPWAQATVALADLESARSMAMIALADLDQLYTAERIDGGQAQSIGVARDQVIGWVGEEDAVLAALRGAMRG